MHGMSEILLLLKEERLPNLDEVVEQPKWRAHISDD